ncbi:MAG: hypothetical protein JWN86_3813 [Planctomycetota bacterium]|nr:hypothetical protein [Planctomycetota bacterium]
MIRIARPPGLVLAFGMGMGLAGFLASAAPAQTKPAMTAAAPPLARYVPKDNLIGLLEFTGLDSQSAAWHGSATYKILTETRMGALVEDVLGQLIDKGLANMPPIPDKPTSAQVIGGLKYMMKKGFVIGVYGEMAPTPKVVMAFRDVNTAEGKAAVGFLRKLLDSATPNKTTETRAGRKLTVVEGGAWWDEKDDLVIAPPPSDNADAILAVIGGKAPSAATHPLRVELAKVQDGFTPVLLGFVDVSALPPLPPPAVAMGLDGVKRLDLRWGFQDEALLTSVRLIAPAPRRGALALLDGPTFTAQTLPPVPAGLKAFTALSLDVDGIFGKYTDLMKQVNPQGAEQLAQRQQAILATTGLNIRKDVLKHLGPKFSVYGTVKPGEGVPVMPGLTMPIPEVTMLAETDDATAFAKSLDIVMGQVKLALNNPNNNRPGAPAPAQIQKLTGPERGYDIILPADAAQGPMASIKPTVRIGKKLVAIASSPTAAKTGLALETNPAGRWTPTGDFAAMAKRLPKGMILLNVGDPRDTLPQAVASLPTIVPMLEAMFNQARPPGDQPAGPFLRIDPAKVPEAEELSRRLAPSSFAMVVDNQGFQIVARDSFPTLSSPATAGVAVALLLPAVQSAREAARRSQCVNNLKQIGLALHNYEGANEALPPAAIRDKNGKALLSWRVAILPYLEQQALYNEFHLDEPWDSDHNKPLIARMPAVYHCPSRTVVPGQGTTTYRVFTGKGGLFDVPTGTRFADVLDGLSNTIAVAEFKEAVNWTQPDEVPVDADGAAIAARLGSNHPGGFSALFADGSVHFLKFTIDKATLRAIITRAAGEVVQLGQF